MQKSFQLTRSLRLDPAGALPWTLLGALPWTLPWTHAGGSALDPAGGSAPDSRYKFDLCAHNVAPNSDRKSASVGCLSVSECAINCHISYRIVLTSHIAYFEHFPSLCIDLGPKETPLTL